MPTIEVTDYQPHPKQRLFHADGSKVRLLRGAWRSGKSHAAMWDLIYQALRSLERGLLLPKRPTAPPTFLLLRKTGPALTDTLLRDFDAICPPALIVEKINSVGKLARILQGGIRFLFRSMDDWRKMGGASYDGALMDEGWEYHEVDFDQVRGRLSGQWGPRRLIVATNPPTRQHWLYRRFVRQPDASFREHHFTTYDNAENLPPDYIADLEKMDEARKRRFLFGEWGFTSDRAPVFPEFRESTHVSDLSFHSVPGAHLLCGWDFGYRHPAVVIAQLLPTGHVALLRELLGGNIDVRVFGRQVTQLLETQFPRVPVIHYCDIAGMQHNDLGTSSVRELSKPILQGGLGLVFRFRKMSLMRTIDQLRDVIRTLHLGVPLLRADRLGCPLTIEALCGGYGMELEKDDPCKDGFYDHLADAMRYAVVPAVFMGGGGLTAPAPPSRRARVAV